MRNESNQRSISLLGDAFGKREFQFYLPVHGGGRSPQGDWDSCQTFTLDYAIQAAKLDICEIVPSNAEIQGHPGDLNRTIPKGQQHFYKWKDIMPRFVRTSQQQELPQKHKLPENTQLLSYNRSR